MLLTSAVSTLILAPSLAMANGVPGSYQITAGETGSSTPLATFDLTNLAPNERIFADGFEDPNTACGSNN